MRGTMTLDRVHGMRWRLAVLGTACALAALPACSTQTQDRSKEPAYLCPRLLERCRECRARMPGFDEWDCKGADGTILERCRGKAAAREQWLEKLTEALAQDDCRGFEEVL
jgi:hypothetical protein